MVMVHGLMAAGPSNSPKLRRLWARELADPRRASLGLGANVGHAQAGCLARPTTKAPETQIYFINDRSGADSVLRLRTVARGERASRSIVNRRTALWSIWVVASLILAVLGLELVYM